MLFSLKSLIPFALLLTTSLGSALPNEARAADAASDMVVTPGGLRQRSQTFHVPKGARIKHTDTEVQVVTTNGTVLHRTAVTKGVHPSPRALSSGWITYASYFVSASTPITSFTTTWQVPANPATNNGQTLFWFNSIEPATFDSILQPVLQWGPSAAGGGAFYAVASWFLYPGITYYTTPVAVSVGQTLTGVMTIDQPNNLYISEFTGISDSWLGIVDGPVLQWATETLESYNVQAHSDYPTGSTAMDSIYLAGPPSVSWGVSNTNSDGLYTTIVRNGGSNARVDIHYT